MSIIKMKHYKVLFTDLDGTLISTLSGETFPKGIWDMKFNVAALEAIKQLQPKYLLIVSNQGGIEKDFLTSRDFKTKLFYVTQAVTDYTHVTCVGTFCESNDKNDPRRKPNPGMLSQWVDINSRFPKSEMLMIGDASGKPGQFSDSDKRTAENFGIDYMDINDFIVAYAPETEGTEGMENAKAAADDNKITFVPHGEALTALSRYGYDMSELTMSLRIAYRHGDYSRCRKLVNSININAVIAGLPEIEVDFGFIDSAIKKRRER